MNQVIAVPASGTFVFINNRDRINVDEPAFDFTVPNLDFSSNEIRTYQCVVKQVMIRNYIPNVQTGVSDSIIFTVNGVDNELVVASGYYNALTLASTIDAFLKLINAGFACGYNSDTFRIFITVPAGVTLVLKRPQVFTNYFDQEKLSFPSKYDRFLEMLGMFQNAKYRRSYTNQTFVGDDPVMLGGTGFVDVNIRAGLDVMHSCGRQLDTVVRVPLDVQFGEDKHYEPGNSACFSIDINYLRNLRVTLTDEWGNKMTVPNSTLFSMSLLMIPIEG